jgi:hypothetical protein
MGCQDQVIVSALQSSLTKSVAGMVLFVPSSFDIWSTFKHVYSQQSSARGTSLRRQLGDCKKLNTFAHDFFHKVKTLSDTLTSIGQPLRDVEFTEYVLHGFDSEYDNLVGHVNGRHRVTDHAPRPLLSPHVHGGTRRGAPAPHPPSGPPLARLLEAADSGSLGHQRPIF